SRSPLRLCLLLLLYWLVRRPPRSALCPYTTLFRSTVTVTRLEWDVRHGGTVLPVIGGTLTVDDQNIPAIVAQVVVPHDDGLFDRSEEHTSELQSREKLVCRLLLAKKKKVTVREACQ